MANEIVNSYHAAVKVDGAVTPIVVTVSHGVASVVRTAVGVYEVTLVEPIALADCVVEAALLSTFAGTLQVRQQTDTVFQVLTADVGPVAAANRAFSLNFFRLPTVN